MKIEAYAVKQPGGKAEPFAYERRLDKNEVLVKISHCAIATGDVQMMNNAWGDSKFPLVAGHEIIGTIEQRGSAVEHLKNGDRVGVGYQLAACFHCEFCWDGNEQFCPEQKVIAVDFPGGLAKHIIVDGRFAFKIPRELDSAKAAPLLSSGLTVYAAIVRANLPENSKTAVLGIGGLGHLAIQFLHKMGHDVSAFSRSREKSEMIRTLGGEFVDSSNLSANTALTRKFDFILSTLNVNFDLNAYLQMLSPQGKLCVVAQPLNKLPLNMGLLYDYAQRTIYGNYTGSRKDMTNMLAFSAKHNIQSMVEVMAFSQLNEAIDLVKKGKVPMKMVLQNTD
ncbi:NAD(P)-dependent alcohol dehydrogenase [Chryseolinea soli]|uniref:NAD(P)-dependent alcohol dehydrogenase n=1 Tax=Chryseolinea soli TaxID=2321403 RepID=A0A385STB9_9BACT|nr:NAD(P)-dependent alcohol dehydrogenase [Chryseolinea soli]AYB33561.1 NAD(P)-dependent alcohol dehydrogenase [Chryseolinea soli]